MSNDPLYQKNLELVENRLVQYGPRKNLAMEMGISESQLSKMLNGMLRTNIKLISLLGIEMIVSDDLKALKTVLKSELRP